MVHYKRIAIWIHQVRCNGILEEGSRSLEVLSVLTRVVLLEAIMWHLFCDPVSNKTKRATPATNKGWFSLAHKA